MVEVEERMSKTGKERNRQKESVYEREREMKTDRENRER